jgi:hypothetical protein
MAPIWRCCSSTAESSAGSTPCGATTWVMPCAAASAHRCGPMCFVRATCRRTGTGRFRLCPVHRRGAGRRFAGGKEVLARHECAILDRRRGDFGQSGDRYRDVPGHGDQAEVLLQRAKSACTLARDLPGRVAEYEEDQENPAGRSCLYENRLRTAVAEDALGAVVSAAVRPAPGPGHGRRKPAVLERSVARHGVLRRGVCGGRIGRDSSRSAFLDTEPCLAQHLGDCVIAPVWICASASSFRRARCCTLIFPTWSSVRWAPGADGPAVSFWRSARPRYLPRRRWQGRRLVAQGTWREVVDR